MAEINIQRKKKPVWPWVVLLLVILATAAIWYFNSGRAIDNPVNATGYHPVSVPPMSIYHAACSEERELVLWA